VGESKFGTEIEMHKAAAGNTGHPRIVFSFFELCCCAMLSVLTKFYGGEELGNKRLVW
jgi:hypothetical protein